MRQYLLGYALSGIDDPRRRPTGAPFEAWCEDLLTDLSAFDEDLVGRSGQHANLGDPRYRVGRLLSISQVPHGNRAPRVHNRSV